MAKHRNRIPYFLLILPRNEAGFFMEYVIYIYNNGVDLDFEKNLVISATTLFVSEKESKTRTIGKYRVRRANVV